MNSFSISKKDALKWLVAVAIPLIIWLMPVTETFTVQIRLFLMITIFAIAAMVMNLLPNMLVAIILPTLYAATGPGAVGHGIQRLFRQLLLDGHRRAVPGRDNERDGSSHAHIVYHHPQARRQLQRRGVGRVRLDADRVRRHLRHGLDSRGAGRARRHQGPEA